MVVSDIAPAFHVRGERERARGGGMGTSLFSTQKLIISGRNDLDEHRVYLTHPQLPAGTGDCACHVCGGRCDGGGGAVGAARLAA